MPQPNRSLRLVYKMQNIERNFHWTLQCQRFSKYCSMRMAWLSLNIKLFRCGQNNINSKKCSKLFKEKANWWITNLKSKWISKNEFRLEFKLQGTIVDFSFVKTYASSRREMMNDKKTAWFPAFNSQDSIFKSNIQEIGIRTFSGSNVEDRQNAHIVRLCQRQIGL